MCVWLVTACALLHLRVYPVGLGLKIASIYEDLIKGQGEEHELLHELDSTQATPCRNPMAVAFPHTSKPSLAHFRWIWCTLPGPD